MTVRSVHWHEGMFLWPQQMQQAERYFYHQIYLSGTWDSHYNWGLRSLDLDKDALANFRLVVRSLKARLPDGVMVSVPEDTTLPALDLKSALELQGNITVYLAVPTLRLGKPNTANPISGASASPTPPAEEDQGEARFVVATQSLEDENTGADSQPIQVRFPNARLLLSTQNHAGYSVLPLARIKRPTQPEGKPEFDLDFIPPLLACAAWKPLRDGLLQGIYDRFGRIIATLAAQVITRGISFDTGNQGDALILAQLQALNEAYAFLKVLAFAEGVHPLQAYLELCRLAGKLAIFHDNPRAPLLPPYNHDDLGGCFYKVKLYLDSIKIREPIYEERTFIGEDQRMQVALEPKWLEPVWEMYVGVQSPLKAEDCLRLFTKGGVLEMKIGAATRVDTIFKGGFAGLKFTPSPTPPRALPSSSDLVYFQVSRESEKEEWQHVQQSLTLAIRFNSQRIVGTIQGQRVLTLKTGSQNTTMQFTLYLVPRET